MTAAGRIAVEARACPLCGEDRPIARQRYSQEPWRIAECGSCGFVYLTNPPGYSALEEDFAWEETSAAEDARRLAEAPVLYGADRATRRLRMAFRRDDMSRYLRWFGGEGAVLDVGCAAGTRVRAPFTPYGIELSRKLAAEADARMRALGGYCLHAPGPEGLKRFPAGMFRGVVLRSYLEHEEAPKTVLAETARVLAPGGRAYVKVPNYGSVNRRVVGRHWCGFRHPDHVNYFTLATLRRMAAGAGLRLTLLNRANLAFDDNIHALLEAA